ncbi:MAG: hypothetical protein AAF443_00820 [Chlamydiota bacterium]
MKAAIFSLLLISKLIFSLTSYAGEVHCGATAFQLPKVDYFISLPGFQEVERSDSLITLTQLTEPYINLTIRAMPADKDLHIVTYNDLIAEELKNHCIETFHWQLKEQVSSFITIEASGESLYMIKQAWQTGLSSDIGLTIFVLESRGKMYSICMTIKINSENWDTWDSFLNDICKRIQASGR